ncbi:MAG: hypothetical protein K6L73_10550 [Cellvibrionaceae bacterium]
MINLPPVFNTSSAVGKQSKSGNAKPTSALSRAKKDANQQKREEHSSVDDENVVALSDAYSDDVSELQMAELSESERREKIDRRRRNIKPLIDLRSGVDRRSENQEKRISIKA